MANIEVHLVDGDRRFHNDRKDIVVHATETPDQVMAYAMDLVKHLGICTGYPDGEDSSGRQRFELMAPSMLVNRALEIAETMFEYGKARGHLVAMPRFEDAFPSRKPEPHEER